jgi:hypothetical protein
MNIIESLFLKEHNLPSMHFGTDMIKKNII